MDGCSSDSQTKSTYNCSTHMKHITIAGGTGLIGKALSDALTSKGYQVTILTRNPTASNEVFWNPKTHELDRSAIQNTNVLINLSGAGIADSKWTPERKRVLQESRVGTNLFLAEVATDLPHLTQFICASGINAFGFKDPEKVYVEANPYGNDFLSQLVKVWELSAQKLAETCKVALVRTAVVLSPTGGALERMVPPVKKGIGSPLGSGDQAMPWIHMDDLVRLYIHIIEKELDGAYNALAGSDTNKVFMKTIATVLSKPFWFPNVPAFALRLLFGEMALMLLHGVHASNEKIRATGFEFHHADLNEALKDLLN